MNEEEIRKIVRSEYAKIQEEEDWSEYSISEGKKLKNGCYSFGKEYKWKNKKEFLKWKKENPKLVKKLGLGCVCLFVLVLFQFLVFCVYLLILILVLHFFI